MTNERASQRRVEDLEKVEVHESPLPHGSTHAKRQISIRMLRRAVEFFDYAIDTSTVENSLRR